MVPPLYNSCCAHFAYESSIGSRVFGPASFRADNFPGSALELLLATSATRDAWVSADHPLDVLANAKVQLRSFRYLHPRDHIIYVPRRLYKILASLAATE